MKFLKVCSLILLFIAMSAQVQSQVRDSIMPDFEFIRVDDASVFTKSNLPSDKKVMFVLFDTSCSHCQQEALTIGKHFTEFKNIDFYFVSMDNKKSINRFMETWGKELKTKENVTVLLDTNRNFITKFQPTRFPAMYIYSEKQKLIKYFGGQKNLEEVLSAVNN